MENEDILEESKIEYEMPKKEKKEYFFKVSLCQFILCLLFLIGLFFCMNASEESKQKLFEGLEFLRKGDLTEGIDTAKDFFDFNAEI